MKNAINPDAIIEHQAAVIRALEKENEELRQELEELQLLVGNIIVFEASALDPSTFKS